MKHLFNRFYYGKRVFITGHTGFKGSWLTHWLQNLGATVMGYSDAVNRNGICSAEFSPKNVRDRVPLLSEIVAFEPDVVFHLAAQPIVSVSYLSPVNTFETNVMGTLNLLDALNYMRFKGKTMIVTSDKVYEPSDEQRREEDPLGGKDPYSLSKACAEFACEAYRALGLNITTLRAGNVIGGGDHQTDRLVPDIVRALSNKTSVILRNPSATRPFQYVLDCLSGYLMAGAASNCPKAFNFGPNESHTVKELVDAFLSYWGSGDWVLGDSTFIETKMLSVDSSLARQILGWEPVLSFDESVQHTANWYLKIQTADDQLQRYVELASERNAIWTKEWLNDLTP